MRSIRFAPLANRPLCRPPLIFAACPSIRVARLHDHVKTSSSSPSSSQADRDFESKKQAQDDRTKIDRQTTEYSQSGTDDAVAAQKSSFEPQNTVSTAGGPSRSSNPLKVSPADPDLSTTTREDKAAVDQKEKSSQSRTYPGSSGKTKTTVSTKEKKVPEGLDRRKPGETPTMIKPGSR